MLSRGRAQKVTVHLNEDTNSDRDFTYEEVFKFLYAKGVAGATLIRPQEGFGSHHRLHDQEGHGSVKRHLPVRIEFIDRPEMVESILPELCELVRDGLIEMHETTVLKSAKQEASF